MTIRVVFIYDRYLTLQYFKNVVIFSNTFELKMFSDIQLEMATYVCSYCTYETDESLLFQKHVTSAQHIETVCGTPRDTLLHCLMCKHYVTNQKCNFRRHITTCKGVKSDIIECKQCNKQFQSRSGLHRHKIKCTAVKQSTNNDHAPESLVEEKHTELATVISGAIQPIVDRLQALEDAQLQAREDAHTLEQRLIDELKATIINNPTNVTNVTNNTMNINMFLNEYCKNAMNIMDFIKAIQIKHSDIDQFGKKCYVEAMTGLMTTELHKLPLNQRPLHCTDHRRQTLHVKHENTWHKEEKGTPILITAIIGLRMACQKVTLDRFKDRGMPEAYKIIKQVTGGRNTQDQAVYDRRNSKIVSKICKAVKLDRNDMPTLAV
jgi:hypothetical protein